MRPAAAHFAHLARVVRRHARRVAVSAPARRNVDSNGATSKNHPDTHGRLDSGPGVSSHGPPSRGRAAEHSAVSSHLSSPRVSTWSGVEERSCERRLPRSPERETLGGHPSVRLVGTRSASVRVAHLSNRSTSCLHWHPPHLARSRLPWNEVCAESYVGSGAFHPRSSERRLTSLQCRGSTDARSSSGRR